MQETAASARPTASPPDAASLFRTDIIREPTCSDDRVSYAAPILEAHARVLPSGPDLHSPYCKPDYFIDSAKTACAAATPAPSFTS